MLRVKRKLHLSDLRERACLLSFCSLRKVGVAFKEDSRPRCCRLPAAKRPRYLGRYLDRYLRHPYNRQVAVPSALEQSGLLSIEPGSKYPIPPSLDVHHSILFFLTFSILLGLTVALLHFLHTSRSQKALLIHITLPRSLPHILITPPLYST